MSRDWVDADCNRNFQSGGRSRVSGIDLATPEFQLKQASTESNGTRSGTLSLRAASILPFG